MMKNLYPSFSKLNDCQLLHHKVDRTALLFPNHVAVQLGGNSITYLELITKANKLSRFIIEHTVSEEIIGISAVRSIECIISLLAILKAGKAYLPLDATYPENRLKQIIDDSKIKSCITEEIDKSLFDRLGLKTIYQDEVSNHGVENEVEETLFAQNSNVFVLYTSGSTGIPKGVYMTHEAMSNLVAWQKESSMAGEGNKTLQFAPLTFDVSFQEIFTTLTTGGTLVLIEDDLRLDPVNLLKHIEENNIERIFLPFVALQFLAEAATSKAIFPQCLKEVMTAGEQLKITPQIRAFFAILNSCKLFNQYGPTECHVVSQLELKGSSSEWPLLPNIGSPIWNTAIYILDEHNNVVHDGEVGELAISGLSLASGYLNKPQLTVERFRTIIINNMNTRVYYTGDLARYEKDGSIEFLGRKDDQVKIRGYRIELGEIEVVLNSIDGIKQAVVVARNDSFLQNKLVAYLVSCNEEIKTPSVRKYLETHLPDYMIPSSFVWLNSFPKTTSGKVDKKALPKPEQQRPEISVLFTPPITEREKKITTIWATILEIDKVGIHDNFFELGGNSLLALKIVSSLRLIEQIELPITKLYQYPTVCSILKFLQPESEPKKLKVKPNFASNPSQPIAIVGMAVKFPGAETVEDLWELLKNGKETITFFADDELDNSIPQNIKEDPLYVKARGVIKDAAFFDPTFFGISPKLAEAMDPQHRLFLEISRDVLEKTGHLPAVYEGTIGVFAGCGNNSYYPNNVLNNEELINQLGSFQVMTANEKDYISSRTAYQLDLKGPAVSVFSGCSTSLLAISQAVESLRKNQCDVAIAGGASVTSPINSGHIYQEGAMFSKDGHCRAFDENASGTVFSDGVGVVLLKTLEAAQADGDTIYGVIKGVGVNNDGGRKGSFTAPSTDGQATAITMAINDANIDASSLSYIEAHGTATPLGDPIEVEGLRQAFGQQEKEYFCAIGSIKSNMGHLTAAAGVAGLIKTTLSLYHKQVPPSIHFKDANTNIDFKGSPFYVNNELRTWDVKGVRRAGVSSFGVGGTNVHVIVEEYDAIKSEDLDNGRALNLFTWSAKSLPSLQNFAGKLNKFISKETKINLSDVAYTLQTTREDFSYRTFLVSETIVELENGLENTPLLVQSPIMQLPGETVFVFPGQGAQYPKMGIELYSNFPVFKRAIDECAELLKNYLDRDIRDIIYADDCNGQAFGELSDTKYTQPALFATEYALAKLWMSWGIEPSILCGHSIGEYVAAHLAGIFVLEDALKIIAIRGLLVSKLPKGSMLAVRAKTTVITEYLPNELSIAAINSGNLCVVSGNDVAIAKFQLTLNAKDILNKKLHTSHAFHSAMMDPILKEFAEVVNTIPLNKPQKPIISTVTGDFLMDNEAQNPDYWVKHLRETVQFSAAITTILSMNNPVLIEVGPGNTCTTLTYQQNSKDPYTAVSSLDNKKTPDSFRSILLALGKVWQAGLNPNWKALYENQKRQRINLPTYCYDKKRYWSEQGQGTHSNPILNQPENQADNQPKNQPVMRKDKLIQTIKKILEDSSGIEMEDQDTNLNFIEIGFDSLLLTQVAISLKNEFKLPITFRKLHEEYSNINSLVNYIHENTVNNHPLPNQKIQDSPTFVQQIIPSHSNPISSYHFGATSIPSTSIPSNDSAIGLIAQQLEILSKQIMLMQGQSTNNTTEFIPQFNHSSPSVEKKGINHNSDLTALEKKEISKPFGATPKIERISNALSDRQLKFIEALTDRYTKKTLKSKIYADESRAYMSDPRVVSGFRPQTKELVYPIVVNKSNGSKLWDIDGNEYIDALNGFGSNLLGYQADVIKKAMLEQIESGYEVGPQHELAAKVCKLVCEFTGFDRSALCSTGSEAVLGCIRIARTVTGRSLIVAFTGSYHGIIDEVLVRGSKKLRSFPAVAGVMPEAVQNILVLEYGTDESLAIIRERSSEIAAVLIEPIQSRRPEFVPLEFVKKVREITISSGSALIFDEVITGFRMHPGGAQSLFDVRADLASYGKVVGGGVPIGVIAGKKDFMDALDGGTWHYGDESFPEVGVTYFAGTFVRHPLALASAIASLTYMKEKGPTLQQELNNKGNRITENLNSEIGKRNLPFIAVNYGSLWRIKHHEEIPYSELMFTLMREKGVHILDGFPCFITEAITHNEIDYIVKCFAESMDEMIRAGFFTNEMQLTPIDDLTSMANSANPPIHGARLGKDNEGNPGWFIKDENNPEGYLQVQV